MVPGTVGTKGPRGTPGERSGGAVQAPPPVPGSGRFRSRERHLAPRAVDENRREALLRGRLLRAQVAPSTWASRRRSWTRRRSRPQTEGSTRAPRCVSARACAPSTSWPAFSTVAPAEARCGPPVPRTEKHVVSKGRRRSRPPRALRAQSIRLLLRIGETCASMCSCSSPSADSFGLPRALRGELVLSSSRVEHPAVNRRVVGSNPT